MKAKIDPPLAVLAVVMGLFLAGALLAYPANPESYSASADRDGDTVTVRMHSSITSDYIVCAADLLNDSERAVWVYYDEGYSSMAGHDAEKEGMEILRSQFRHVGVDCGTVDAEGLYEMFSDLSDAPKSSVIFLSGSMPSNVYSYSGSGYDRDLVKPWMEAGGLIHWYSGYRFGYYSALGNAEAADGCRQPMEASEDHFGIGFLDTKVYGDLRSEISLMIGTTQNIIDTYAVMGSDNVVNLGYGSADGRCSLAYVKFGTSVGGVTIPGGSWSGDMSYAKIIASCVCDWDMSSAESASGSFRGNGTVTFEGGFDAVYVYYGNITPRYGDLFLL